jgi:hypothetical protein
VQGAGADPGQPLFADATMTKANASMKSLRSHGLWVNLRKIETACTRATLAGMAVMVAAVPVACITTGQKTVTKYYRQTTAQGRPIGQVTARDTKVYTGDPTAAWLTLGTGAIMALGGSAGMVTAKLKAERDVS